MSEFKRKQGRPTRIEGEVGKTRIIHAVRELWRSEPQVETSRKVIARCIGVTPALITYYFAQKDSLFDEVCTPVIEEYAIKMRAIVGNPNTDTDPVTLGAIISLLADLYSKDRKILEVYRETRAVRGRRDALDEMHRLLADYFGSREGGNKPKSFEAAVLQGAVQGMCDFANRAGVGNSIAAAPCEESAKVGWINRLQALFLSMPNLGLDRHLASIHS